MDDQQLIDTACPIIGEIGAAFYFVPATMARGSELGLDALGFYIMGRGGVLGDVEPPVVLAAFGYFKQRLLERAWTSGRAIIAPRAAGQAYMECCAEHGRTHLAGVPDLAAFVVAAEKVLAACDGDSLPLFAGIAAEPAAADVPGRAMQLLAILREYRGSAHLLALRAVGLDSKTAHHVKRPNDTAMFGWKPEDAPVIDDAVHAKMAEAEALTDRLVRPAYSVLSIAERVPFVETLHACKHALTT
ncbi:MAG: hypothetical protein F2681_01200 [Actinobacteria bacterium]|uniref:Unannotated protein n=1 Tax=freshwater metagenome TaxID=449393 RepID=A0A6J7ATA5_9ZZZZ|nr:hypothetical protein [Actinomycetota bacterium]MSW77651.1 hypothetical protein [Actinomycetota bacterium]MSX54213.1 hypothetical protein [Actinomycetota bacterium]MSX94718.1 hypothetical protein [Actinomycetota bacterium]MSZ81741.1 hypothetical protein [Actinomycetota bacterium]